MSPDQPGVLDVDDVDTFPSFYSEESAEVRTLRPTLAGDHRQVDRFSYRTIEGSLEVTNAAALIREIPAAGEQISMVLRGNFDAWDVVPAIAGLAVCAIDELVIATLGFRRQGAEELLAMLDADKIRSTVFVCSHFWRTHESDLFEDLYTALAERGQRAVAIRSHAKLLLFHLADGRRLTWASSANLRSCNNFETAALTNDANLHDFHRRWLLELVDQVQTDQPISR